MQSTLFKTFTTLDGGLRDGLASSSVLSTGAFGIGAEAQDAKNTSAIRGSK
ncbi:MAG: hypothetical protein WD200_02530 [Candidatus Andersenbacteria bacterium]